MAAKQTTPWTTISLRPLSGALDTRSRPADIPAGAFRYKLNCLMTDEGKLCRRDGFDRFYGDYLYDDNGVLLTDPTHGAGVNYHNHDHHHQGATREPITMMFESYAGDGTRRLFDGTQSRISLLNPDTGYWTDLATGKGTFGSRWKVAELQNKVVFTNNVDSVLMYDVNAKTMNIIPDLDGTMHVTKAKVCLEFNGFMLLFNVFQDGARQSARVRWSDYNDPTFWEPAPVQNNGADSLAGYQDLDYGDDILAALPLLGAVYIYTRKSIWRMTVSTSDQKQFDFQRVYTEPKNQAGCLTYPNSLFSDGNDHWYMSQEGIYHYNPYIAVPERYDWLHRASGTMYRTAATALNGTNCDGPIGEFRPLTRELWFSWPSSSSTYNNWTLVVSRDQQTADIYDHGFFSFLNFKRQPAVTLGCNESSELLSVSTQDWAIKSIGGVFFREFAALANASDPTVDLPLNSPGTVYFTEGYRSILRGLIPAGYSDRNKEVRNVLIDADTSDQDVPCVVQLRIGNSYNNVDPNDTDDHCAPQWRLFATKPLSCADPNSISAMTANNQRPEQGMEWPMLEEGRFLFYEITIQNSDGSPGIGGDTCFERIDFDMRAKPKR